MATLRQGVSHVPAAQFVALVGGLRGARSRADQRTSPVLHKFQAAVTAAQHVHGQQQARCRRRQIVSIWHCVILQLTPREALDMPIALRQCDAVAVSLTAREVKVQPGLKPPRGAVAQWVAVHLGLSALAVVRVDRAENLPVGNNAAGFSSRLGCRLACRPVIAWTCARID